jgi:hypothetical protein
MSATSMMPNTCTVTPNTNSQSATSAGMTFVPGTPVTGVVCSIQVSGGREFLEAGRIRGVRTFECYFPIGTVLAASDRLSSITGGSIGGMSGFMLSVTSPPEDHAGRGTYLFCTAEEIQV